MSICRIAIVLGLIISTAYCGKIYACDSCGCETATSACFVERTVMRPQYVTETRMCTSTEYRYETRQRTITVQKCVAETAARSCEVTVMVPEQRTKTIAYTVRRPVTRTISQQYQVQVPVWNNVQQSYTVQVPHVETRQTNRIECRRVPVTVMKTVCRDAGSWVNQTVQVPGCDPCGRAIVRTVCRPVYMPKIVSEQVPTTCYKTEQVSVPYQYNVTVCKPEVRTRTLRVCNYRMETRTRNVQVCETECVPMTREVAYTCYMPQKQQRSYNVTTYRMIPEKRVETYKVCVPHQVQKPVQVRVCHMVPETIQVPVCSECGDCCS